MPDARRSLLLLSVILLAALALYAPGLSGPLLFDDKAALSINKALKIDGTDFDEWRVATLSSNSGPLRRPVAMFSFALNHVISGDLSQFGLKAVNLAIHLLTGFLLYHLFYRVFRTDNERDRRLVALVAAGIWLLHPLHVSTVLYAVQRMAQLSTLFAVAGLLTFVHYRQRWARSGGDTGEVLAAGLWLGLFTLLAGLSKENGLLLPWLVAVVEVCVYRGEWAGRVNRRLVILGWSLLLLPLAAMLLVLLVSPDSLIGGYRRREFSLEERLLTQGRLLWRYLGWFAFPNINDMGFQHDDIPLSQGLWQPWTTALSLLGWLLALVAATLYRRRFALGLLALLFFLVGHSMESGVFPLEMVYEHRNYLPGVFVCLALGWVLVVPARRSARLHVAYPVLGVLALLAVLLSVRVNIWGDELTLSRVNLGNHPESSRSNYFYANALLRQFNRREQAGLTDEEAAELLLLSRHYFERMHQQERRDVAALVMLYYLDSRYFPEMQSRVDWLTTLEEALAQRRLQASDWNALETLVGCFISGTCAADRDRVLAILDALRERYPGRVHPLRYRYKYLSATGAEPDEMLPLLEEAQRRSPRAAWVYYGLMYELARLGEVAAMYDYALTWLQRDRKRHDLQRIKALFEEPAEQVEAVP